MSHPVAAESHEDAWRDGPVYKSADADLARSRAAIIAEMDPFDTLRPHVMAIVAKVDGARPHVAGIDLPRRYVVTGFETTPTDEDLYAQTLSGAAQAVIELAADETVTATQRVELHEIAAEVAAIAADGTPQGEDLDQAISRLFQLSQAARQTGQLELAEHLEQIATALHDLQDAAAEAPRAAEAPWPRTLAPPGRAIAAQPVCANAPPARLLTGSSGALIAA